MSAGELGDCSECRVIIRLVEPYLFDGFGLEIVVDPPLPVPHCLEGRFDQRETATRFAKCISQSLGGVPIENRLPSRKELRLMNKPTRTPVGVRMATLGAGVETIADQSADLRRTVGDLKQPTRVMGHTGWLQSPEAQRKRIYPRG